MPRDISGLTKKPGGKVVEQLSADEFTRRQYLEDIARMRDFTPPEDKMLWPEPIGPKWKN